MDIGIFSYSKYHLKTSKLVEGFLKKKYKITVILVPFNKYNKRRVFFNHRPNQFNFDKKIKYLNHKKIKIIPINNLYKYNFDYLVVGGAGLIDKKIVKKYKIINCHPGLVPQSRGLDSFKWIIYNNLKLGNTLHFIDKKVDYGEIISHKITPVFKNDNLENLAKRHYNNEIDMLLNFQYFLNNKTIYKFKVKHPHKRMKFDLEKELKNKFFLWKKNNIK